MRFKLSTLMLVMSTCAIYLGVFWLPGQSRDATSQILAVGFGHVAIGGINYANGAWRAFWIGSTISWVLYMVNSLSTTFTFAYQSSSGPVVIHDFGVHIGFVVGGLVVVGVRWFCLRNQKPPTPTEADAGG